MKFKLALFSFVLISLNSCSFDASKYYTPSQANATKAAVSVEELVAGRTTYINACKKCHKLKMPNRYSAEEWPKHLDKMQKRAKISDLEKQQIYQYLISE